MVASRLRCFRGEVGLDFFILLISLVFPNYISKTRFVKILKETVTFQGDCLLGVRQMERNNKGGGAPSLRAFIVS